jgi:hypothetical protein
MATRKAALVRSAAAPAAPAQTPTATTRKPWVKKTPVEVVLDQIAKQQEKVDDLRADLAREEKGLAKLQKAKAVLEAD